MKKCKSCKEPLPFNLQDGIRVYVQKQGYGLNCGCFLNWISDTENGKAYFKKFLINNKKEHEIKVRKENKAKNQEFNEKKLMYLADKYFSRYIRLKFSLDGNCTCYTCGTIKPILEVDNGHFMKRVHKATRYHENNCRPQCKTCNGNIKHNGKQIEFKEHLVNEIGEDMVEKIEKLSKTSIQANHIFYKNTADYYRVKTNELQKELKIKIW